VRVLRRSAVLIAVAMFVGLTAAPAQAGFDAKLVMPPVSISTVTVAAPGNLTAQLVDCNWGRTQDVRLNWTASATARVSGYRVTVFDRSGATLATAQVSSTTTSATVSGDNLSTLTYSVTTLTAYGWTAATPRTGASRC
jgi:hypothetical protein